MSKAEDKALALAYENVVRMGWTHTRLSEEYGMSMPTLRRIRDGRDIKGCTREYCLKVFVSIIHDAFHRDLEETGGAGSHVFNRMYREVLEALVGVTD